MPDTFLCICVNNVTLCFCDIIYTLCKNSVSQISHCNLFIIDNYTKQHCFKEFINWIHTFSII